MADYQQNFMNALQGGLQFGQQIKGIQDQRRLNELASQGYGAPREQRTSLLGQLASINPQAAAAQRKQWSADDEMDQEELVNMARFIKSAPPEQQAAAYSSILPKLRERGMQAPEWTPETQQTILQTVDALVNAYGGAGTQTALAPRVVGDALVDSTGKVLYQSPQEAPKPIWDSARGVFIQQPGAMGQQVTQQDMEGDIALANELIASGVPEAQVDAFLKARGQRQQPQQGPMAIPVAGVGPKVDEGPQETFSQPQPVTYPDGSVRLVQFGNRGSRREVEGVAPPPTDRDAKPPTEGERKAATLLQRLNFSLGQLQQAVQESPDAASPSLAAEAARRIPFVGDAAANTITPAERQRVEAAQLDILDAALTLGTGAAYTREQLEGYRRSYFPQIGDSQATIDDKADRLNNVIEAARIAAGRAAPEAAAPAAPGGWKIERVD